ncbi:MAG TPA: hypothetical protein VJV76_07150 [Gaiellaceae bacterium]|nr:hypothetical protein [Gaiellaceae bacterium]
MRYVCISACAAVFALALAGGATAGSSYTLHPAGFGTMSYAAWKAQQGTPDDQGNANQALYFQKKTTTATVAAGVAVINGLEGVPASELTGLSWWHREDGHCGAGAPRWDIGVQDSTGARYTVFLGCNAAEHTQTGATTNGIGWCKDAQLSPGTAIQAATGQDPANLTITGLAIVFDEGTDVANPPPAGCEQQGLVGGFVYLDNIDVQVNGTDHCWTSASDNGNASAAACDPQAGTSVTGSTSSVGLPSGLTVDPTDAALVNGLDLAEPNAPLLGWLLYPNVIY